MEQRTEQLTRKQAERLVAIQAVTGHKTGPDLIWDMKKPAGAASPCPGMIDMIQAWLLDREQKKALSDNPEDRFYLLASAYLFATVYWDERTKRPAGAQRIAQTFAEYIEAEIVTRQQAAMISRVYREAGKQGDAENLDTSLTEDAGRDSVNIALLAAVIRLAHALDLTSSPTADAIYGQAPAGPKISHDEFRGSYKVLMTGPHAYLPGTIRVQLSCSHPESHRLLKHHERRLQALFQYFNSRVSPRFLYSEVVVEIEPQGYEPVDMKFSVDSSAALQLFTGNRLYADKRVFLRELIQNAVDACGFRKIGDDQYQPDITISFNEDISIISVRDNGIGMDRQWIEKYFLKIGISFYQSGDVRTIQRRTRLDFSFISQFGIGFLSSFLVSEKIVIKTRKSGSRGLMITISNLKDYFDVRYIDDAFPQGTEVTLHLKPSAIRFCRSLEYTGYLKTHIRYLRFPVRMVDEKGHEKMIGCEPLPYDPAGTSDPIFTAKLGFEYSEGYLQLKGKDHVGKLYALESTRGGISIFQDGIFVTQTDALLPEGARQRIVGRINLQGRERCELSMDRNRIFWTEKEQHDIRRAVRRGLVVVVNALVATMLTQDLEVGTQRSIINQVAIFFDFNEFDDTMHKALCKPVREVVAKRFRDFVRIHYAHTLKRKGISEANEYSEVWQQGILEQFVAKN